MLKLRYIGVALALALMLCVTMLGSGTFAQSVSHNKTSAHTTTAVATNAQHTAQLATTQQTDLQRVRQASKEGPGGWHRGWRGGRWHFRCGWWGWGWHRHWMCRRWGWW